MDKERILHSLDGIWNLQLDPEDVGKIEKWCEGNNLPSAVSVTVPGPRDRCAPGDDGPAWYCREFQLGDEWKDRAVSLEFDAVSHTAEVWLNGTPLGQHRGGHTPFALDATHAAIVGLNRLTVRVENDGPHQENSGGIHGPVRLVGKAHAHITEVFIRPDIRRRRITVDVSATDALDIHLQIEGTSCETTGPPGVLSLDFPDHATWSPENPQRYTLRCQLLRAGEVIDAVSIPFGMREFTVKENRFHLNNRPIALKAVLLQGDYPDRLSTPESLERFRKEIELAREAGFNTLRFRGNPPPGPALDLADELGLLIYEDFPLARSENTREFCEQAIRETVRRDRNHPSLVIWGIPPVHAGSGAAKLEEDLRTLAHTLDPSRLILHAAQGHGATPETSHYLRPYHDALEPYDNLRIHQRAPVDRSSELYLNKVGATGALAFLSEFGFGGMEDLAEVVSQFPEDPAQAPAEAARLRDALRAGEEGFRHRQLDRVFGDFSAFAEATRALQADAARIQVDAVRINTRIAGYCYTQLSDSEAEFCAGILDRSGRPKPVFDALKQAQAPLRVVIDMPRTNLVPRQSVHITVTLLNERRLEDRVALSLQVVGPTNQVLWKKKRDIKIPRSGKELWSGSISASGSPGIHKFVVRIMKGMERLAENTIEFHVLEPAPPCDVDIHLLDPQGAWTKQCAALAKPSNIQAPIHIIPPLANTIRAYPDNQLAQILGQVKEGAVALFFQPPEDWNDLAELIDPAIRATSCEAIGGPGGVYHYAKLHALFDGLPARGLMRQAYRRTVAPRTFLEAGEEDICGTFDTAPLTAREPHEGQNECWGNDILVHRYGSGRIVFTHLRILDHLGDDPVADRLFVNMLKHFARRAVPAGKGTLPIHQKSVEWLRKEREERVRHWRVLGPFPNMDLSGHETAYPPEQELDFNTTYPGWYHAISWSDWYATAQDGYFLDLQTALSPFRRHYPFTDYGTGYAYAELNAVRRGHLTATAKFQNPAKVWLNGTLIFETTGTAPGAHQQTHQFDAFFKQGRNTLLVKLSKTPGPFGFTIDFQAPDDMSPPQWRQ